MSDCGKPGINWNGSIPARERNPELVAFAEGFVRLLKNEVSGVSDEILRSKYLRLRFQYRRVMNVISEL